MRRHMIRLGLLAALALAAASCVSPLDPATPRNKYIDNGGTPSEPNANKFHPDSLFVIVKLDNEFKPSLTVTEKEASVDTTVKPWAVWLRASGVYSGTAPRGSRVVYSFMLRIDSTQVDGMRHPLTGDPRIGQGIMIVTGRVVDSTTVTPLDTLFSMPPRGSDGMRFLLWPPRFDDVRGDLNCSFGDPRFDIESYIRMVL